MTALLAFCLLMGALWGAAAFEDWRFYHQPTGRRRRRPVRKT